MTKKKSSDQMSNRNLLLTIAGIALLVIAGALFYEWKKSGSGLFGQARSSQDQAD